MSNEDAVTRLPDSAPPDEATPSAPTRGPQVRWPVFIGSFVGITLMAAWALFAPTQAADVIWGMVEWVTTWFGWFYVLLSTAILLFVIGIALSRYGRIRLGPDDSRPQFSLFAWASMLFAAGIGTDVMFFSVVEPATQYMYPPVGEGETVEAAREATVWTLFHYGISGWGMYALMGMALAYAAYRMNLPLAIRSALYPIFGKRIDGALGHTVDSAAVVGTIFGVATSLGIGVVFLNVGLNEIFPAIGVGTGAQVGLIILAIVMAAVSATTGVDRGIRLLSQLNVLLALALAFWVLITGSTSFLMNAAVMNIGDFVRTWPAKTMETFAYDDAGEWMSIWTLFFWAWWIAWASFVGLFLARISRGRTIRQFVVGTLIIPFAYIVMWISIFGNAALEKIRSGDDVGFAELAQDAEGRGFYALLQDYPAAGALIALSVVVGLLFYVTSADSGALVMANLSSRLRTVQEDGAAWLRIAWATITGVLTMAVLIVGGIPALQYATVIMGLPFAFVLVLVMISLLKALRSEDRAGAVAVPSAASRASGAAVEPVAARPPLPVPARRESGGAWQDRLAWALTYVGPDAAVAALDDIVEPALRELAEELTGMGVPSSVSR
ncbi:MAG: choline BCCT transporter BetT, partial [Actinomycetia bacterium]|nr:choline BCCT transporter BetT [Actinomycetes bacterium]